MIAGCFAWRTDAPEQARAELESELGEPDERETYWQYSDSEVDDEDEDDLV
jgi:hypothetical protein